MEDTQAELNKLNKAKANEYNDQAINEADNA